MPPVSAPLAVRHLRAVRPLFFPSQEPESEKVPQSKRHHRICELLVRVLLHALGREHTIGCDQYVYFDGSNPRVCLAPDAFVKLGVPDSEFDSWKTWERGTPELAVEILSPSDSLEAWTLEEKLARYHALGVRELVCFDADAPQGQRIRAWDRVKDDLIERVVEQERTPCVTLPGFFWVVAPGNGQPAGLRLARDELGREVLPTPEEEALGEAERERAAKDAALAEVERLRAELRRNKPQRR